MDSVIVPITVFVLGACRTHKLFKSKNYEHKLKISLIGNHYHLVPSDIDQEIARMKLSAMKIHIDTLTEELQEYLSSWQEGT